MAGHSYRQLVSFGTVTARRMRAEFEIVGVFDEDDCRALTTVRIKKLPAGLGGVAYISGGPLLPHGASPADLRRVIEELAAEYVDRRRLVLRIAPPVEWTFRGLDVTAPFDELGFGPCASMLPYRTIVIDLHDDLAEIRRRLHGKWRNCLKAAERADAKVRVSADDADLARFGDLHVELMGRKRFDVDLDVDVYRAVHQASHHDDRLEVRLAEVDGEAVAGHVASYLGQTCIYLFGASTPTGNRIKASYILQWNAIVAAKERGMRWYDLGGIDPDENEGVYRFKARMGGIEATTAGPFDLEPRGVAGRVTRLAEREYRRLRWQARRGAKRARREWGRVSRAGQPSSDS